MIPFTEKLKGAEKVVIQVLHVVMTYEMSKIHVHRKRKYLIIFTYHRLLKFKRSMTCTLAGQNTLAAQPMV